MFLFSLLPPSFPGHSYSWAVDIGLLCAEETEYLLLANFRVVLWKSTRPTVARAEDKFGEPSSIRYGKQVHGWAFTFRRERCYQALGWLGTQNKELPGPGEG